MFSTLQWFGLSVSRCINLQRETVMKNLRPFLHTGATSLRYLHHIDPKGFELFSVISGFVVGGAAITNISPFSDFSSLNYVGKYFTGSLTDDIMFTTSIIQFFAVIFNIKIFRILSCCILFPTWSLLSISNFLTVQSPASYVYAIISISLFVAIFGIGETYDVELDPSENQKNIV